MARIVPVIETPLRPGSFWLPLSDGAWPRFIELTGDAPPDHVALAVLQLCTYGSSCDGALDAQGLATSFPSLAPGGLAVIDGANAILPSCCCGLEGWRAWYDMLTDGSALWLGHDPAPWVERTGDAFIVWADGGMGPHDPASTLHMTLSREELERGLAEVERHLTKFATRMLAVLSDARVSAAPAIVEQFREAFIVAQASPA